jgi:RHS repeat-associated protein
MRDFGSKSTPYTFREDGRVRRHPLERLTCAYFGINEDPSAPCALSYDYAPNGNLTFKSDVGVLAYGDPAHPHAVKSAGGGAYGYDAVGNQIARPGGVAVSYTPFDLPASITQGPSEVTFGYDGDQQRIRKTTPTEETLYFGDLYERVTEMATAMTEHRYYLHSPERVVAVVTRGGKGPGVHYVHVDNLGSVDALTDKKGTVAERRSYDPFGQRRSPIWGQPPPASFSAKTTKGFTGHEEDSELGLVNAKGRIFDPKLGRFLTTDPIVSRPYSGQSWNAYSYVLNNPLRYVDPFGFQENEDDGREYLPARSTVFEIKNPDGTIGYEIIVRPLEDEPDDGSGVAYDVGAAASPTDMDTTGSSPEMGSQQASAPDDWVENPYVQIEGGFLAGLAEGFVPFGGVGHQLLDMGEVIPHGSSQARFGLAFGQVLGGIVTLFGGVGHQLLDAAEVLPDATPEARRGSRSDRYSAASSRSWKG